MGPKRQIFRLWLIVLFWMAAASGQVWGEPVLCGKLVLVQGEVAVRSSGETGWVPARLNQDLFTGDLVRTGALSRAAILAVDESQIKLNENTLFLLKSAAPSPRLRMPEAQPAALAGPPHSSYEVPQGEVWLRNSNEKFRFELETPAVTAAIRGTEFNIKVFPDGASRLTLLAGSLSLVNAHGTLALKPGEEGLARPGQAPSKRALVSPGDAVQWSLYYPGIISFRDLPLTAAPGEVRASGGPPAIAALINQAEAAYDEGRLGQAQQEAEAALKQDPQNDRALILLGWLNLQRHAPEEAQGYFRRVRQADDRGVIGLALAQYRLGDARSAYSLMQQARGQLRPTPLLVAMSGFFALQAGKVEESQADLDAARSQSPASVLPQAFLAQIHLVQNRRELARQEASQLLARSPDSPLARLTLALVEIASFNLPAARRNLEMALRADPRFVEAYVYLARIWLGSEYLDRAWRSIEPALKLAPREGEVLTQAGFIRLGYRDYQGAAQFFTQAIKAGPGLGEPHLGMGHYHFRYREFNKGLTEILTATLLEPRVALYQSNLGKALYQVRAFDKALEIYDYAKTLDPRDPTPYFYKGVALTDLNRPGEAVQEINRSIELNDNRAIFRSRLMLDRDLAVRNFDLARAYIQLGLGDWATSKAVTAVKNDFSNSSAHRFLGAAYLFSPQRTSAATTEILLNQLLSPANQNTFSLGNDYTPMFEMPYFRVLAQGGIGAWRENQAVQEHGLEVYGGRPGLGFTVGGFYRDDRGFRARNSDDQAYIINNITKYEPTVKDSFTGYVSYLDREVGDNSFLSDYSYQNAPRLRRYEHWRTYQMGYVRRFNPNLLFLTYFNYQNNDTRFNNFPFTFTDLGGGFVARKDFTETLVPRENLNFQMQKQLVLGNHTFISGFDYFSGHLKFRQLNRFTIFFQDIPQFTLLLRDDSKPPDRSTTFYLIDYWKLTPSLLLELGVFGDFAKNSRPGFARPVSNNLASPLLGVNYSINARHTLRLAVQRHLNVHDNPPLLAPADVAGFPRQINTFPGSEVREAGVAWEAQWNPRTFSVARLNAQRISTPQFNQFVSNNQLMEQEIWQTWKRYVASLAVNRILSPSWGLAAGVAGKRFVPDPDPGLQLLSRDFSEVEWNLGLFFRYPQGWFGGAGTRLVYQHLKNRSDNLFGLVDLRFGKEFANKRGQAVLEVTNLFNRHFSYQQEFIALERFYPVRRIMFKLALWF